MRWTGRDGETGKRRKLRESKTAIRHEEENGRGIREREAERERGREAEMRRQGDRDMERERGSGEGIGGGVEGIQRCKGSGGALSVALGKLVCARAAGAAWP